MILFIKHIKPVNYIFARIILNARFVIQNFIILFMKKYNLILLVSIIVLAISCKKETDTNITPTPTVNIAQKQNAAYIYWGGTWCGPCGTYAKPVKELLHEDTANSNAVFISCQLKNGVDPFASGRLDTIADFYYRTTGVKGAPTGWIAGGTTYTRIDFPNDRIKTRSDQQTIMNNIYKQTALVNGIATVSINGNIATIKTTNKFFKSNPDTFYIQVIITESNLQATQNGDSSVKKNIHDFVWRTQSGIPAYGDVLVIKPSLGQMVEKTVKITLDSKWKKENCEVNVLIWNKRYQLDKWNQPLWGTIENSYKTKLQ